MSDSSDPEDIRHCSPPPDVRIGATFGVVMGAAAGAVCCWLVGEVGFLVESTALGAAVGLAVGSAFGLRHRNRRRSATDSTLGITIGIVLAMPPAILVLLGGPGLVNGKLAGLLMDAAFFAIPFGGLIIGGLFDRAYESYLQRRYGPTESF